MPEPISGPAHHRDDTDLFEHARWIGSSEQ